jgi:hypothetical protein
VVVVLGVSRHASAQSAEAEALFADGQKLVAAGKLAEACDAFDASNRLEQRAGTLIALGDCREKNQQLASAWSAYKDALTRVKDPRKRQHATAKVAQLEPRLSYLTVSVADDARVDGLTLTRNGRALDGALWNRALPVDGGSYVIAGRAPGHEEWSTTVVVPTEGGKTSVEVPKFKEMIKLVVPAAEPAPGAGIGTAPAPSGADVAPSTFTTRRKVALGVAGLGLGAAGLGIVMGVQARAKDRAAKDLCPDPAIECANADEANALASAGQSRALVANISFGIAGAALIGAGVLWFTGKPAAPGQRATWFPSVAPGAAGLAVAGSF